LAASPTFRRGDVIARRYQVVTKSGETSLWIGFHGFDKNNQTSVEQKGIPEPDVLIKLVRPELLTEAAARSHLSRELQRVKGLQHPGMPRLIDVQLLDEMGSVALIEPIQSGLSQGVLLRRMVTFRKNEGFPLAEVRQISAQLASALSYVHGQMMCHGDLRLESVLLRPDGAKLCDIGLGAALPRGPYLDAVKKAGEAELLAPEVRAGKQPDPRSDVFGLASLYRHLISLGQQSAWETFLNEKPAMGMVLVRGMAEDPGQRYSSIEALIADVEAVALTGAPIRKRLAQTPLAMAVAAGRLPAEELSRPVEEIVAESGRSRRNTGGFEVGAVLAPLSGGPAAKMSIGTIPPSLSSQASTRSGRLVAASSESATSKAKADALAGSLPPDSGPPSAATNSNRITMPGRSKPISAEAAEAALPAVRGGAPGAVSESMPATVSSGKVMAAVPGDATVPMRTRTRAEAGQGAAGGAGSASAKMLAKARPSSASPQQEQGAGAPPSDPGVSSSDRHAPAKQRQQAAESERSGAGIAKLTSKQSPGSRNSPHPSGGSPRWDRLSSSQSSIPPNMVVASRRALIGALILAALVGALAAVVVVLLLRPASGLPGGAGAPAPLPSIASPPSPGAALPASR